MSEKKHKEKRKKERDEGEGKPMDSFADWKGGGRTPRWEDKVRFYALPPGKWVKIRLISKLYTHVRHWLKSKKNKNFPVLCLNYNPRTNKFDKKVCPACAYADPKSGENIRWSRLAYVNIIPRAVQKKEKDNPSEWRHGMALPAMVCRKIAEITELEGHEPYDPKKGYDLEILYNPAADPSAQYNVQRGEKTKLSEQERNLELYDFSKLVEPIPAKEVQDIMDRFGYTGSDDEGEADDGEDDSSDDSNDASDEASGKDKKRSKKKEKKKGKEEEGESDDKSDASDSSDDDKSDDDSSDASDSSDKSDDDSSDKSDSSDDDKSDDDSSDDDSSKSDSSDDDSSKSDSSDDDSSKSDSSDDDKSDDDKSDSSDDDSSKSDSSDDKGKATVKKRGKKDKDKDKDKKKAEDDDDEDLGIDLDLSDDDESDKKDKKRKKK